MVQVRKNHDALKALELTGPGLLPPEAFRHDQPWWGIPWRWPLKRNSVVLVSLSGCETVTAVAKVKVLVSKDEAAPELAAEVVSDVVEGTELASSVSELMEVAGLTAWEASYLA